MLLLSKLLAILKETITLTPLTFYNLLFIWFSINFVDFLLQISQSLKSASWGGEGEKFFLVFGISWRSIFHQVKIIMVWAPQFIFVIEAFYKILNVGNVLILNIFQTSSDTPKYQIWIDKIQLCINIWVLMCFWFIWYLV